MVILFYYSLSFLSLNLPFAITKTNLVFFVVSLGNSDSKQKVATSETQSCFTFVL